MSIVKMLDASTCHITHQDAEILERGGSGVITFDKSRYENGELVEQYGWFIHIPEKIDVLDRMEEAKNQGMSHDFANLLWYAWCNHCRWICLDRDGAVINELPQHDW